jgi:hypothetical protein
VVLEDVQRVHAGEQHQRIENLRLAALAVIKAETVEQPPRTDRAEMMLKVSPARGLTTWVAITSKAVKRFGSYYAPDDAGLNRSLLARRCMTRRSWLKSLIFQRNGEFPFANSLARNSTTTPSPNLIKE